MTVKEYINKNLPNLNWNILPQIFEDEGVELTEEIKVYLKETPGNTNWNIFKQLKENNSDDESNKMIVYLMSQGVYIPNNVFESMGLNYRNPEKTEIFTFCEAHNNNGIAQDFIVRILETPTSQPSQSSQNVVKVEDVWAWYSNGINNAGYFFTVDESGEWKNGSWGI